MDAACDFLGGPLSQELEDIAVVEPGVVGLPEVPLIQAALPLVLTALLARLLYAPAAEPPLPRMAGALLGRTVVHACSEGVALFDELGAISVDEPAAVDDAGAFPVSA